MKKGFYLVACFFLFSVGVFAQQSALDLELERAQLSFDAKKFNTAATLFKKAYPKIKEEEKQNQVLYMIAESYRCANNFKQAYDWYEKLVNTKYPDPRILYSYGLLLKNFEKYEDASRQFNDYLFEVPGDISARRELQSCAVAQSWKNKPEKLEVHNIRELNTVYSDYAPFYIQGKMIWASARQESTGNEIFEWTGQKCSDFFESNFDKGVWSKPKNLKGAVNTDFNEGVCWIDTGFTTMYFTQCNGADGRGMNCKIYESHMVNGSWSNPTKLPFCSDSFSVGHPSMHPDGTKLYFSSNMPGGLGERDIYVIDHNPNTESWGTPVNLGSTINSNADDMFPFISNSGVLYFSTKGRIGMGGLDIFSAKPKGNGFDSAVNMKYPVNSGGDEFGLIMLPSATGALGAIGYYSSNREGGIGDDDIYGLHVKPFIFQVKGRVLDKDILQPLSGAKVALTDAAGKNVFSVQTNAKGEYFGEIPLNQVSGLLATMPKYFSSARVEINANGIQKDSVIELDFILDPIPTEEVEFVLEGIYYDLDKYDLRRRSMEILDSMVVILKNNPGITIELASHTDSRAPADYNITLSQKRAQTCVTYLVKNGINKERLTAVGYGETKLVNDCADGVECTEEEHQQNRRTTFRVLKMDFKGK